MHKRLPVTANALWLPLLLLAHCSVRQESFFIGTYTSANGSQGIYEATLDPQTGVLSTPVLAVPAKNPSYLAFSPNCRNLYAVDESNVGSVSAFALDPVGRLSLVNSQPLQGGAPCYLSVDRRERFVLAACYTGGVLSSLPIMKDGSLGPVCSQVVNVGTGPNLKRQEASHMHWVHEDPSGRFVYSCDLGTDKVRCYGFSHGTLSALGGNEAKTPPGAGPRHGAFGRYGHFLYVAGEMGSSVSVFAVDSRTGALKLVQTLSSVSGPPAKNTAAEIEMSRSGRSVYVSNRGDNSIAVFDVLLDGTLSLAQVKPLELKVPRGFAIDPSGRWLVVGGQSSNDLEALPIGRDGRLGDPGPRVSVDKPVCVVFSG